MNINAVIIISYKIIFNLSLNIFFDSNKIIIKSFSKILFISNFSTFELRICISLQVLLIPDSLLIIPHVDLILLLEFRISCAY